MTARVTDWLSCLTCKQTETASLTLLCTQTGLTGGFRTGVRFSFRTEKGGTCLLLVTDVDVAGWPPQTSTLLTPGVCGFSLRERHDQR
jgi:hypothetical protein